MKIESKHVVVPAAPKAVFDYLSDMNNFKELLPQDRISDWESREDYCSFKIQNTATIDLQKTGGTEAEGLVFESGPKSPFKIKLEVFLKEEGGETAAYQICNADVNAFLKMMVEKPLRNLFDYIADRLVAKFQ